MDNEKMVKRIYEILNQKVAMEKGGVLLGGCCPYCNNCDGGVMAGVRAGVSAGAKRSKKAVTKQEVAKKKVLKKMVEKEKEKKKLEKKSRKPVKAKKPVKGKKEAKLPKEIMDIYDNYKEELQRGTKLSKEEKEIIKMVEKKIKAKKEKKKPSNWVNHVKKYAKDNKMTYREALQDKKCKNDYYCNVCETTK